MSASRRASRRCADGAKLLQASPPDTSAATTSFLDAIKLDDGMADAWLGLYYCDRSINNLQGLADRASRLGEAQADTAVVIRVEEWVSRYRSIRLTDRSSTTSALAWAYLVDGDLEAARDAALDLPDGDLIHAEIAEYDGDLATASSRYQAALDSTNTAIATEARMGLARVLREQDQISAAREIAMPVAAGDYLRGEAQTDAAALVAECEALLVTAVPAPTADVTVKPAPVLPRLTRVVADPHQVDKEVEEILAELDRQIGLEPVKQEVRRLLSAIRAQRARQEHGLKVNSLTQHMVFTGPPGTGKTTIARLIARLLHALGILATDNVVEVDRSGLVGEHLGSSTTKTSAVLDQARGGVLFIDEAYSLQNGGLNGGDAFGSEAIDTILKRMEDERDNLVVIAAGYSAPMRRFIASNPGLRSRFTVTIGFPSYSPDELVEIGGVVAEDLGDYLTDEGLQALREAVKEAETRGLIDQPSFGNARWVRTLVEKAARRRDERLFPADQSDVSYDATVLAAIEREDIEAVLEDPHIFDGENPGHAA